MATYVFEPYEPLNKINPIYKFYTVYIIETLLDKDGNETKIEKHPYSDFVKSLTKQEFCKLEGIYGLMSRFSPNTRFPQTMFRPINGDDKDRVDVFEFKKKPVRVYICKDETYRRIFLLSGGVKNTQDDDIERVFRLFNEMTLPPGNQ